jgi:betaine reductase
MSATTTIATPVISEVKYFLAHTPGLVRYGVKVAEDIARKPELLGDIQSHLRPFSDAVSYAPNRAFLGGIYPDELLEIERPWRQHNGAWDRSQPRGEIMPEEEFICLLKMVDAANLVSLDETFVSENRQALEHHALIEDSDLERLGEGQPSSTIEEDVASGVALPLHLRDGTVVGCVRRAHEENASLSAEILLENLACKAAAVMAVRTALSESIGAGSIDYVLNTGEEAVGDAYQRGGGNMAKAVGEMCGLENSTGSDVKAFCAAPVHALVMASTMVASGLYKRVAVIGGCSLAKLGMNYMGHLGHDEPIIEDVLAAIAVIVERDDGVSPVLRLDSVGGHYIGAGSSIRAISRTLITEPLVKVGLKFADIDKYAIELQNPEITEPAGIGDVTERNYKLIAALAVQDHQIARDELPAFAQEHGMPGFSSTQGHIASAVPFLGHAVDKIMAGEMQRAMFVAKGSLFLGRMTQMSDGFSFILEKNPGV